LGGSLTKKGSWTEKKRGGDISDKGRKLKEGNGEKGSSSASSVRIVGKSKKNVAALVARTRGPSIEKKHRR